ncbi:MAG: hypothetical protein COX57_07915 [Alphaproteobacteria bacterium CG_4_10_14_0_2_um_filter_63_37]|nr:MAG: hypothetical protein COX57_07915 [Alphaproteobacteria bacterium CG_4_10_14_0_2_um_filter_63_37]
MSMKICFFARVRDKALFEVVEFYKVDIDALRALGHEVVCVNTFGELLRTRCDLYYIWWFGYGVFPTLLAKLKGRPAVMTGAVHTTNCGSLADWPFHKRILMELAMKLADRNLFISNTDFKKLGSFEAPGPEIAYCAVDTKVYSPDAEVPKTDTVVTITHLTKENVARKLLLESIEAFALFSKSHPTYTYQICGSFGDAVEDVRQRSRECGVEDKVVLHGRVSHQDKIAFLRAAKAYLQPSTCEGFGLAILEAKGCGTPVVTSPEPCILEINGDSVIYGQTQQEWAEGLARLADDPSYFEAMRRTGLERLERFTVEARRRQLQRILASLEHR